MPVPGSSPGIEPGIQTPAFGVWMAGSILGSSPRTAMTEARLTVYDTLCR